jgi:hypothetical protein
MGIRRLCNEHVIHPERKHDVLRDQFHTTHFSV